MATSLSLLAAAAVLFQAAAILTEVAKPGGKRHASVAHNDTNGSLAPARARVSEAPGLACGMTMPVGGGAPGIGGTKILGKTLQECLDLCVATASCQSIISHHHGVQDCYLNTQYYESHYVPYDVETPPYVSNKLAGANCDTKYDFLFHGCPRGTGLTWDDRSSNMKIWECQAACDSYSDCLAFEINGCLDNPNCGGSCWTFHGGSDAVIINGGCDGSGSQESYLKVSLTDSVTASPTANPTASPTTASPTASPTATPTPPLAAMEADLIGDPHVTNVAGKRFDVHQDGDFMLLQIPQGAKSNMTLLRLDGHMKKVGDLCSNQLYLDSVSFMGKWVLERNGAAHTITARKKSARATQLRHKQHFHLGSVHIVLIHARTDTGINYLNLHVNNLGRVGTPIGGLLGEDDFSWAHAMPAACQVEESENDGAHGTRGGSTLVGSAL